MSYFINCNKTDCECYKNNCLRQLRIEMGKAECPKFKLVKVEDVGIVVEGEKE